MGTGTGAFLGDPCVSGTLHLSGGRTTEAKPVSTEAPTTGLGISRASMRRGGIDVPNSVDPESTPCVSGSNPIMYSRPAVTIVPAEGVPTLLIHALRFACGTRESLVRDIRP